MALMVLHRDHHKIWGMKRRALYGDQDVGGAELGQQQVFIAT